MPVEDVFSRVQEIAALAGAGRRPVDRARDRRRVPRPARPDGAPAAGPRGPGRLPAGRAARGCPAARRCALPRPRTASRAVGSRRTARRQSGLRALAAATGEIGVQEEPPGSNDGAAHRAVPRGVGRRGDAGPLVRLLRLVGRGAGRRAARRGGPGLRRGLADPRLGRSARAASCPAGEPPRPGDLILFGSEHVGIVESVGPGDRLTTVEGNHSDRVERVERSVGEATGFVRI